MFKAWLLYVAGSGILVSLMVLMGYLLVRHIEKEMGDV